MQRLVLTAEQTKKLATATGSVEVVNSFGHTIGQFTVNDQSATETQVLTPEVLAEMRRIDKDSKAERGPAYKGQEVRDKA